MFLSIFKKNLFLLISFVFLSSSWVMASIEERNKPFWQPKKDKFYTEADIQIGTSSYDVTDKSTGSALSSTSQSLTNYLLSGGYGFNDQWAIKARFFPVKLLKSKIST